MDATVMLGSLLVCHLLAGAWGDSGTYSYRPDVIVYGSRSSYPGSPYPTNNNPQNSGYYGQSPASNPQPYYYSPLDTGYRQPTPSPSSKPPSNPAPAPRPYLYGQQYYNPNPAPFPPPLLRAPSPAPKPQPPPSPTPPAPVPAPSNPPQQQPQPQQQLDYCRPRNVGQIFTPSQSLSPRSFLIRTVGNRDYQLEGEVDVEGPVIIIYSHDSNLANSGYSESRTKIDFTGQTLMVIKVYRGSSSACMLTEYYCGQNFNFFGSMVINYVNQGLVNQPYNIPLNYRIDSYIDRETLFSQEGNIAKFCAESKYIFHMVPGTDPNPRAVVGALNHQGLVNIYVGQQYLWI